MSNRRSRNQRGCYGISGGDGIRDIYTRALGKNLAQRFILNKKKCFRIQDDEAIIINIDFMNIQKIGRNLRNMEYMLKIKGGLKGMKYIITCMSN